VKRFCSVAFPVAILIKYFPIISSNNNKKPSEKMMRGTMSTTLLFFVLCFLNKDMSVAFAPTQKIPARQCSAIFAAMENPTESRPSTCGRREAFLGIAAAFTAVAVVGVEPASAKYSDYSRREKDWQERQASGEIKYSSARDLRKQLADIVPANSEGSKVFCPNGPSAAVSPLMENKCSDVRMALPSVYGRTTDSMGNSIPGYQAGYDWSTGSSSSITSAAGGFPSYYKK
jgi:hypothetical protein